MTRKTAIGSKAPAGFHIEANRCSKGISLLISAVVGVSDFSSEEIVLKSHGGRIVVSGKKLVINVYENNTAEVIGKIEGIGFIYGRN